MANSTPLMGLEATTHRLHAGCSSRWEELGKDGKIEGNIITFIIDTMSYIISNCMYARYCCLTMAIAFNIPISHTELFKCAVLTTDRWRAFGLIECMHDHAQCCRHTFSCSHRKSVSVKVFFPIEAWQSSIHFAVDIFKFNFMIDSFLFWSKFH